MKILLYTDVHWSITSSIIRGRNEKFSCRLEKLINSVSWAEDLAIKSNCDEVVCLGDFFNNPDLKSEELTALQEVKWCKLPHIFLVGNHESPLKSLYYNSTNALKNLGFDIHTDIQCDVDEKDKCCIYYIPYQTEDDRIPIKEIIEKFNKKYKETIQPNVIIFSHNDIKGLQYGCYKSTTGFDIEDIESNCKLFLNGHLHNGMQFCKNGINLGNLTGQNFLEDSFTYTHNAFILDTSNFTLEEVENPYAFNFYQFSISNKEEFLKCDSLKQNSVVLIKCKKELIPELKEYLNNCKNIIESRISILIDKNNINLENDEAKLQSLQEFNYLDQLYTFAVTKITDVDENVLKDELNKIVEG